MASHAKGCCFFRGNGVGVEKAGTVMLKVSSCFILNFKLGDNINHNLSVLALLYDYYNREDEDGKRLLCKPIIILLVSIIEAVLHDFHSRIRILTYEGIANLSYEVIEYIRGKKIDELEKYIASARKHDLFGRQDGAFYDLLDELWRLRNRIHIQNTKADFEPSEYNAFNEFRKRKAERALELTMKTLATKYPRPPHIHGHVADFNLPLSFPKIPSERIRAMRENQSIIRRDACHPLSAWGVCRQPVHVAAPA
jgi:hypothetical protein